MKRTLIVGLAAFGLMAAGLSDANAAKPKPGDDGARFCVDHDSAVGDGGVTFPGPNQCCYEEKQNEGGDTLKICLKCDSEWKNCKTSLGSVRIDRTGMQDKSSGAVAEPPRTPKVKSRRSQGTIRQ